MANRESFLKNIELSNDPYFLKMILLTYKYIHKCLTYQESYITPFPCQFLLSELILRENVASN